MSIWTSLSAEAALITTLEATGRLATTQVGTSAGGTPILVWRIGGDTSGPPALTSRAVVLFVGGQHGDEPAGREAALALAETLCNTVDAGETAFLDAHGVLILPTANPDGHPDDRENADGQDINRHHLDLQAPEARAIAEVLGAARPLVVADLHEFGTGFASEDLLFADPSHPATYSGIVTTSAAIISDMEARATVESWTFADYPSSGVTEETPGRLVANCGLRHSASVLIETRESADDDPGQQARVDKHTAMCEEILAYCIANSATLLTDATTAEDAKTAEGEAGTTAYETGEQTIDPPPLGYRITGAAPVLHLRLFNIDSTSSGVVTMGQAAQPIIPMLLDPQVSVAVATAVRLFALPATAVLASVQDLASVITGSHTPVFEARVLSSFQSGFDPDGDELSIVSGHVVMDGTANVERTLDLTTVGVAFPRRIGDTLLPDGTEVFVRRGVAIDGEVRWAPLGYFRVQSASRPDDHPRGEIRLTGFDRMRGIIDAELLAPRQFAASQTFGDVFGSLISDVHADATILFDDDLESEQLGRQLIVERSRYEPLRTLAQGRGKIFHVDGEGVFRIRTAPDPDDPIWTVAAGRGGVLVRAQEHVTREQVVNAVVVRSQAGDTLAPARAVAIDDGPQSITRFGGRFGEVPAHISVPAETTLAQARDAARATLLRRAGLPHQVTVEAVPNAALIPFDPIRVVLRDGTRQKHVSERLSVPLWTEGGAMGIRTREQRLSLIRVVDL